MTDRIELIGDEFEVPANASRFLADEASARRQPVARMQLAWHATHSYLLNSAFDQSLIAHDDSYCTSVVDLDEVPQVPTAGYFKERVLPHLPRHPTILDIGCGQGEFVEMLRSQGIDAMGYDPVLKDPKPHLIDRYWSVDEQGADVFVMRCVLPHMAEPWRFVRSMGRTHPGSLLLVEFQRLEWILENAVWYQLSHDHVNLFTMADFLRRFEVVDHGTFSNGEWGWVLIRPDSSRVPLPIPCPWTADLECLLEKRHREVAAASLSTRPMAVWGAAGKGIVLAHALLAQRSPLIAAIDADPKRHDKFMEVSGLPILGPKRAAGELPAETSVLVANPNHLDVIRRRYGHRWEVGLPSILLIA